MSLAVDFFALRAHRDSVPEKTSLQQRTIARAPCFPCMLGFSQNAEKRQAKAEAERADHALDAARILPLEMQQDVARRALTECTGTFDALSKSVKERESLYRLRN